jgi:PIN domain nuclease of toxin-antitoxin system
MENIIFLDTHIVVWLYSGKTELFTSKALSEVRKCELYISPIVKLELSYLFEIEKIKVNPDKVLLTLNQEIGLKLSEDSFIEIIDEAMKINWTRDPFDRIITAQAKIRNAKLLTKDQSILSNYNLAFWD